MSEYASEYYDPVKAHEYYMRTRELKGYENRYGGHRGDGTSAASSGSSFTSSLGSSSTGTIRSNASGSSKSNSKELTAQQKHNKEIQLQIQNLRDKLSHMSKEDRKNNADSINDQIQRLRQQIKGGSTSGFNQKGREAAAYIKKQIETERDEVIKKTNKDVDKDMLDSVKRLAKDIEAMRKSGRGFSQKEFGARIKSMLGQAKKKKIKAKRQHIKAYQEKYKSEIDKLRGDESMYDYWDKRNPNNQSTTRTSSSSITGSIKSNTSSSKGSKPLLQVDDKYLEDHRQATMNSIAYDQREYDSMSDAQKNSDYGRSVATSLNDSKDYLSKINDRLKYLNGSVKQIKDPRFK